MKVNELIRSKRKEMNMTQQELADLLYVSSKTISKWETGRGLPEMASVSNLVKALELDSNQVVKSIEESTNKKEENVDRGIMNAYLVSGFLMLISIVFFALGNYYFSYFHHLYLVWYILFGILFVLSFLIYFIMENNRSLKLGYRKSADINRDRFNMIKIWTGLITLGMATELFTINKRGYQIWEMGFFAIVQIIGVSLTLFILYKLTQKK